MTAKELRIGNYVYFQDTLLKFDFESGWNFDYIKPIPLTEEWLLKFGFIRHHYDYANDVIYIKNIADNEIDNAEFEWGVYPNELGSGIQIKNRKSLKYVHEIQNLYFALTGEELSVNFWQGNEKKYIHQLQNLYFALTNEEL